jgi:DNA polymerase/3'-5' exonuclease PolX
VGLKYYDDLLKPIPRKYIDTLQVGIRYALARTYGVDSFKMVVGGSYRRGEMSSGDIDCVVQSEEFTLKQMIETLKKYGIIIETLTMSEEKFQGLAHCPSGDWFAVRLDIEFPKEDEWGATLIYFTGSKALNTEMRQRAKDAGLILHQHGLLVRDIREEENIDVDSMWKKRDAMPYKPPNWTPGTRVPAYTEREIFQALDMAYIPPKMR